MFKRLIIANDFSVNMLPDFVDATIEVKEVSKDEFVFLLNKLDLPRISIVDHRATADILSQMLGFSVSVNRINYVAKDGDVIAVFIPGTRLEEGRYFFVAI